MCGRYALALRAGQVRQRLQESNMPSQHAPADDEARDTYNFAPGYFGLVYRAEGPTDGHPHNQEQDKDRTDDAVETKDDNDQSKSETGETQGEPASTEPESTTDQQETTSSPSQSYKLQAMKWGLIPFWTKRQPDYGSMMRTINARDDSLAQNSGMWTSMKQKKRCIVLAQGFYEWLKKNGGKEKIPHYVCRKDGQLMCFAGLYDSVRYEDAAEPLYTYTIITTASNQQLGFLHDRMPVILDNGSPSMFRWLDRTQTTWTAELQDLLQPYAGELECYPVSKDVGKVGNNSPSFIVPIDSAANKQNIANFFGNQAKAAEKPQTQSPSQQTGDEANPDEPPATKDHEASAGSKRPLAADTEPSAPSPKAAKTGSAAISPSKPAPGGRATRSATKNASPVKKSPAKATDGSQRITSFFKT